MFWARRATGERTNASVMAAVIRTQKSTWSPIAKVKSNTINIFVTPGFECVVGYNGYPEPRHESTQPNWNFN